MFCSLEGIIPTNIHRHFEPFEHSNPISAQETLTYDVVLSTKVWLQTDQHIVEIVIFDYESLRCDLEIEDSEPLFLHDTPPHNNTPPYQVWLKMVERFRRHYLDKLRHTDRWMDGQTDEVILIYHHHPSAPIFIQWEGWV